MLPIEKINERAERAAKVALELFETAEHHGTLKGKAIIEWLDRCRKLQDELDELLNKGTPADYMLMRAYIEHKYTPEKRVIIYFEWEHIHVKSPIGRWLRKIKDKYRRKRDRKDGC